MPRGPAQTPQERLANPWWRLLHSWWILVTIVSLGLLTWAAFLYIGVKAQRRSWCVISAIYLVVMVVLMALLPPESKGPDQLQSDIVAGLLIALWLTGIMHAFMVRRTWLRIRASLAPWHREPAPFPGYPSGSAPQPFATTPLTQHPTTPLPTPLSTTPPMPPAPSVPLVPPTRPTAAEVVDVNSAAPSALSTLPGMTDSRIQEILHVRERLGGFRDFEALAAALRLEPHELIGLRDRIAFSPVVPPTSGPRLLDL